MKNIIIIIILLITSFATAKSNDLTWLQQKADSLVISFWGVQNFKDFIRIDKKNSQYCQLNNHWDRVSSFNKPLTFSPNLIKFSYKVNHRLFKNAEYSNVIEFYLDTSGALLTGFKPVGLYKMNYLNDEKFVDQKTAIFLAKNNWEYSRKKIETRITWIEANIKIGALENCTDADKIDLGRFAWRVSHKLDKPLVEGCFSYYNKFIHIDLLTSEIIGEGIGY